MQPALDLLSRPSARPSLLAVRPLGTGRTSDARIPLRDQRMDRDLVHRDVRLEVRSRPVRDRVELGQHRSAGKDASVPRHPSSTDSPTAHGAIRSSTGHGPPARRIGGRSCGRRSTDRGWCGRAARRSARVGGSLDAAGRTAGRGPRGPRRDRGTPASPGSGSPCRRRARAPGVDGLRAGAGRPSHRAGTSRSVPVTGCARAHRRVGAWPLRPDAPSSAHPPRSPDTGKLYRRAACVHPGRHPDGVGSWPVPDAPSYQRSTPDRIASPSSPSTATSDVTP